ncbi:MAG: hypothetical protein EPN47_16945 [Acidobacteria bacterium]|nr:MAG: hypothetical protein EPN47_16945 [Acidobacteriota bacterium]
MSVLVLVMASALCLFYVQTICDKALRREFRQAYFKQIIDAARLEYPQLRDSAASKSRLNYAQTCFALKCDFFTLQYLLKNSDPSRRGLARAERLLGLYFRLTLSSLAIRHVFNFRERETVLRLASILQYFANSLGERVVVTSFAAV